ncbi:MAG: hypothetical protein JOZ85_18550 [Betaproteobacteria bacterium]|nr:hypothetical protein [Betaproteobacteria bacterium]
MDIFSEALNLVRRYEKGDAFRNHVSDRTQLIAPVIAVCVVISIALCIGIVGQMDHGGLRAFAAVIALPIILIGSALLQIYLFFSWLELRALAPMLAHDAPAAAGPRWLARLRRRLGKAPPMPWISVALLLVLPLLLLATKSPRIALLVVALALAAPITYAHLDR